MGEERGREGGERERNKEGDRWDNKVIIAY